MAVSNDVFIVPPMPSDPESNQDRFEMSQERVDQAYDQMRRQYELEQFDDVITEYHQHTYIDNLVEDMYAERPAVPTEINPTYQHAKEVESLIEQIRNTADQTTIPRFWLMKVVESAIRPIVPYGPKTLKDELVDVEAYLGGVMVEEIIRNNMLAQGYKKKDIHIEEQMFFYHEGAWHYRNGKDGIAPVAVYRLEETGFYKSVEGTPVAFNPGEAEALLQMIPLYYEAIQKSLYQRGQAW